MVSKVIEPSFLFLAVATTLSFESFATNSKSSPLSSPPSNAFLRFKVTLALETFGLVEVLTTLITFDSLIGSTFEVYPSGVFVSTTEYSIFLPSLIPGKLVKSAFQPEAWVRV